MDHGIFISYSRDDEKQALHLLDVLRREGFTVWIDQEAIAGASIWSDEIVQNIKQCEIFIALLSDHSVASNNVGKEIALAAEHGKIILPVEIGHVALPGRLEYALAGIQKTSFSDEAAILHAVRSQVARLSGVETDSAIRAKMLRKRRMRSRISMAAVAAIVLAAASFLFLRRTPEAPVAENSVVVLPFATLNIDHDSTRNLDIFSDEMISRFSRMPEIRTASASTSSSYRDSRLNPLAIAQELNTRFIIDGLVRKMRDVEFISVRVFDVKKGGEVWEQTFSGNNRVLFPIREQLCHALQGFFLDAMNTERDIRQAEANLASHAKDAPAYARLAGLLMGTDKVRALDLYNQAIKLDSSNLGYYLSAGITAEHASDQRSRDFGILAVPRARILLERKPDSLNLAVNYAIALDIAGQSSRASEFYDSMLVTHPNDVRLTFNAACCFSRLGRTDRALDLIDKLLVIAPGKRSEVQSDPDFDNIRSNPRYLKLMYDFN
jgi:TolB-like protein